jgi:hypothetical protein
MNKSGAQIVIPVDMHIAVRVIMFVVPVIVVMGVMVMNVTVMVVMIIAQPVVSAASQGLQRAFAPRPARVVQARYGRTEVVRRDPPAVVLISISVSMGCCAAHVRYGPGADIPSPD